MTKPLRLCVCSVITLIVFARPAAADWHFTPFVGTTFGGNTTFAGAAENLTTGQKPFGRADLVVGGVVSLMIGGGPVGIEGIFTYVPGIVDPDEQAGLDVITGSRSIAAMGNIVLTPLRRWNEHGLRPFVSGGVGLLHLTMETTQGTLTLRRNVAGYNVGGGAVGFVSDRTGLRFEARRFAYLKPAESTGVSFGGPESFSYWTATVGVVFRY